MTLIHGWRQKTQSTVRALRLRYYGIEYLAKLSIICKYIPMRMDLPTFQQNQEIDILKRFLTYYNGNRTHTAEALGIKRTCLEMKLKRLGMVGYIHGKCGRPKRK